MSADLPHWNLGIPEASGLGLRRVPRSGATELLAIGDRFRIVVGLRPDATGRLPTGAPTYRHRVWGLPDDLENDPPDQRGSQWEGVAGDVTGRVFILRERNSELLVVSPDFRFERRIALRHKWRDDKRSGLEGLLLMRDGHVLAAKQKDPVRLIEFGPAADEPIGLTEDSWLAPDAPATLSPDAELYRLADWSFADPEPDSVNDLAAHAGRLYLISSADRNIRRVRLPVEPDAESIQLDGRWKLPDGIGSGPDAKAEGLFVDDRLGVLVCVDSRHEGFDLHQVCRTAADLDG